MNRVITLTLLLCVALLALWSCSGERKTARTSEPGPFPSEWFLQQRTWPAESLDPAKVISGARQAAALRNQALDEDPHWFNAGPLNIGGRLTDIVARPTDDNIIYIAAASGGVFKSTDGALSWSAIFDGAPTPSIGALAIDPNNPNTIYCGTGEANSAGYSYFGSGLYKSSNGGDTWNESGLQDSRYIARVVVHPQNSNHLWVAAMGELFAPGGARGVYFSDDAGQTWDQKLFVNDTTGASDVVVHPENSNIVYAAMWQRIRNSEHRQVGGRGSGIYKSTDRGENWTRLSSGLPPIGDEVGRIGLAIAESNPNVLYAIYADHPGYFLGLYRSADAGETWTQTNDNSLADMYSSFGWYFGNVRVRPDDENMVFALGVTLHRSTNGGTTWSEIGGNVHVDHHALWFDPQQPFRFLLGNDGGLYRSQNNGNSFEDLNNFPAIQFYAGTYDAQQPHRLYGGTQDNGTLRCMNGAGDEFERIYGGDGFYTLVDPTDNDFVYAEYQYGGLGRSTDGGESFDWALNGIDDEERRNWSTPVAFDPNDSQTLYYGAQRVYRTTNRAVNWSPVSPDLTNGPGSGNLIFGTLTTLAVSPANSDVLWAGTDDANVWVSTNGGNSWTLRNAGLPERWITRITPHSVAEGEALVTVSGYRDLDQQAHLYHTTNFGESWSAVGSALPDVPLNDALYDPEFANRLYVASDFGIFWSQDYGAHWSALGRGLPPVPTLDLILDSANRRLIAATYGRSFVTLELDSLGTNHAPEILDVSPASPHFAPPNTTIQFAVIAADPDGDPLTYRWYIGADTISMSAQAQRMFTEIGDYVVFVSIADTQFTVRDSVVVHIDTTTAAPPVFPTPSEFAVSAFPNPFNNEARLTVNLTNQSLVTIVVYSVDGREVAALHKGALMAGTHLFQWKPVGISSGTYIARIQAGSQTSQQKLIYLK